MLIQLCQVDVEDYPAPQTGDAATAAKCDLIASILHTFLLRIHSYQKSQRLGTTGVLRIPGPSSARPPPLLQPIIDLLQYQVFCERVKAEVDKVVKALDIAGVPSGLRFNSVGETGRELVRLLNDENAQKIGGEAVLRVDNRYGTTTTQLYVLTRVRQAYATLHITFALVVDRSPPSSNNTAVFHSPTCPAIIR